MYLIWSASCEKVSFSAQSDLGYCPLIESLGTKGYMNGEQMPGLYFTHAQDDVNLCILRILEGTFSGPISSKYSCTSP